MTQVATTEAIPLYHKRQSDNPIIDKLEEKVKTITDEMRGKARWVLLSLHS